MDNTGRVLGGRYRLIEPIGKGGMGSVWRAEHTELGSLCAVKLIDDDLAESAAVRARFRREAKAAAALVSDHVVRTFDYGVDEGTPYIVMELLAGESLDQRLKRNGRLSATQLSEVLSQVALALDRAHQLGLVHRDLKPGNLFVSKADNGRDCIKLLDFGIAKSLRIDDDLAIAPTRTGAMVGSPAYMSPEQLRNAAGIDPMTDIWSLGVVGYEALLGQRPFTASTMADLTVRICSDPLPVPSSIAQVPQGFDAWFAKACHRDRAARFSTAIELADAFEALRMSEEAAQLQQATQLAVTSTDVPITTSSVHLQSTEPLARTANDVETKGSTRNYWLLGGVSAALVATMIYRNQTRADAPHPASGAQSTSATPRDSRPSPLEPGLFDDAGPLKAEIQSEPVPNLQSTSRAIARASARSVATSSVRSFAVKAMSIPSAQRSSINDAQSAPSASPAKPVPDRVYGF